MQLEHSNQPAGNQQNRHRIYGTIAFSQYLHNTSNLIPLILAGEERQAGVQLCDDAAEAPHVDLQPVAATQDDLRRAVEAALNVGVNCRHKGTVIIGEIRGRLDYGDRLHYGDRLDYGDYGKGEWRKAVSCTSLMV